MENGAILQD